MQKCQTEFRHRSQPFDIVAWVEKKYCVPPSTARLIAELAGISRHNYQGPDISPSNIMQNIAGEACGALPSLFGGTAR